MRFIVATPHSGRVEPRTALSVAEFLVAQTRLGHDVEWVQYESVFVHVGRCALVDEAIRREVDGILFWDADTIAGPEVARLTIHPVAVAAVRNRHDPSIYAVYLQQDGTLAPLTGADLPHKTFKVAAAGAALLWVGRRVLLTLHERGGRSWPPFQVTQGLDGRVISSEDINFSRAVREAGFEIVCDPTIATGHVVTSVLTHAPSKET